MKKMLSAILAVSLFACTLSVTASAAEPEEELLIDNPSFVRQADMEMTPAEDGTYQITLTNRTWEPAARYATGTQETTASSAQIVAYTQEDANAIMDCLKSARSGGGSLTDSESILGDSIYMEVTVRYTSVDVNGQRAYRMEEVSGKASCNSGSILTQATLNAAGMGSDLDGHPFTDEIHESFGGGSHSSTVPSTWPYIIPGDSLGASVFATGQRPSGESASGAATVRVF